MWEQLEGSGGLGVSLLVLLGAKLGYPFDAFLSRNQMMRSLVVDPFN